ncbi:hypothetical protein CR983_01235 [Candidatus Saccharibacteria bacterium]|nr:MAG: hypothetical protein CR983_01235 [Candidatus Saccharibacteria bacterium]
MFERSQVPEEPDLTALLFPGASDETTVSKPQAEPPVKEIHEPWLPVPASSAGGGEPAPAPLAPSDLQRFPSMRDLPVELPGWMTSSDELRDVAKESASRAAVAVGHGVLRCAEFTKQTLEDIARVEGIPFPSIEGNHLDDYKNLINRLDTETLRLIEDMRAAHLEMASQASNQTTRATATKSIERTAMLAREARFALKSQAEDSQAENRRQVHASVELARKLHTLQGELDAANLSLSRHEYTARNATDKALRFTAEEHSPAARQRRDDVEATMNSQQDVLTEREMAMRQETARCKDCYGLVRQFERLLQEACGAVGERADLLTVHPEIQRQLTRFAKSYGIPLPTTPVQPQIGARR